MGEILAQKEEGCMRYMSRLRYNEIETRLEEKLDEELKEMVMSVIREVMKFDPEQSAYLKLKGKLSEEGSNTYTKHKKSYYERHKEEISKKMAEKYQKKKAEKVAEKSGENAS